MEHFFNLLAEKTPFLVKVIYKVGAGQRLLHLKHWGGCCFSVKYSRCKMLLGCLALCNSANKRRDNPGYVAVKKKSCILAKHR